MKPEDAPHDWETIDAGIVPAEFFTWRHGGLIEMRLWPTVPGGIERWQWRKPHDEEVKRRVRGMLLKSLVALGGLTEPQADAILAGIESELELRTQVELAQTFYTDSKGFRHRITEMPNGYLHNAVKGLKRRRVGGVGAITVLAMDAEIARREASKESKNG